MLGHERILWITHSTTSHSTPSHSLLPFLWMPVLLAQCPYSVPHLPTHFLYVSGLVVNYIHSTTPHLLPGHTVGMRTLLPALMWCRVYAAIAGWGPDPPNCQIFPSSLYSTAGSQRYRLRVWPIYLFLSMKHMPHSQPHPQIRSLLPDHLKDQNPRRVWKLILYTPPTPGTRELFFPLPFLFLFVWALLF